MNTTSQLFEAFLKCPTKCWLRAKNETASGNTYAEWVQSQNESYRCGQLERMFAETPPEESARSPSPEKLKASKWRLAVDVAVMAPDLPRSSPREEAPSSNAEGGLQSAESSRGLVTSAATPPGCAAPPAFVAETRLHAVERVPAEGRGRAAQFIPIRCIFFNKLTQHDKLLLAFDAFALGQALGRDIVIGKIIHGDLRDCARSSRGNEAQTPNPQLSTLNPQPTDQSLLTSAATFRMNSANGMDEPATWISPAPSEAQPRVTKVKTSALAGEVRKRLEKIAALLSSPTPPDLVLSRHCAECEFHARCRKIAIEKDDLSLLAGMSAKEREKLRSKGILTVTQLSYTFRPRRRPKRLRDKREKYHHALKALAIREKKIYIVGSPELKIEGTPVYLDVEGLPDRDFYYLIGLHIGNGDSAVQHSLWADTVADEGEIWREFLAILETVEKPVLIHYGSYETTFLKTMCKRYRGSPEGSAPGNRVHGAVNLVSAIFARVYFASYSNGLKDVARSLSFEWFDVMASGPQSVVMRSLWEQCGHPANKEWLGRYNTEDCKALEIVSSSLLQICAASQGTEKSGAGSGNTVKVDSMKPQLPYSFGKKESAYPDLDFLRRAAYWDYQRDRLYLRPAGRRRSRPRKVLAGCHATSMRINKVIVHDDSPECPMCKRISAKAKEKRVRILYDLRFGHFSVKRWVEKHIYQTYSCWRCQIIFGLEKRFRRKTKFGWNLAAYFLYQVIELSIPQHTVTQSLNQLFGFSLLCSTTHEFKSRAAEFYQDTQRQILSSLIKGSLLHADETRANVRGQLGYVWVFTNLREVVFLYADTREADMLHATLAEFKGVLVSDFYAAYDSLDCPQQKCLMHLSRDLNDEVLAHPYDQELKELVKSFGSLVRPMVETVDQRGLKRYFLRKHKKFVDRFYRELGRASYHSEAALKCKDRFERNRRKLFTFLDYDGVPWNNNNAEHAIKAYAALRNVIEGTSTRKGIEEYLVLLSVCQTCKYMGVDFLDFLRSGKKDIHLFAESRRRRGRRSATRDPQARLRMGRCAHEPPRLGFPPRA